MRSIVAILLLAILVAASWLRLREQPPQANTREGRQPAQSLEAVHAEFAHAFHEACSNDDFDSASAVLASYHRSVVCARLSRLRLDAEGRLTRHSELFDVIYELQANPRHCSTCKPGAYGLPYIGYEARPSYRCSWDEEHRCAL